MMNKVIQIIFKTFLLSVLIAGQVNFSYAQTASILPPAKTTFLDNNGKPLVSGKVKFYIPGTTTNKTTWQDSGETIPNTNPVVLDGSGRAIILGDGSYRQQVFDRLGNLIWDQQTSSQGSGGGGTTPTVGDGDAVGTVKPWSGLIAPNAYVFTYGQELARASFPLLFSTLTSQQNVACTSGSPTLTGLSDTTQLPVGAAIESVCLNAGATVASTTISTVTASSNAIISTTSSARFFPFGNGDGSLTFNVPDLRGRVLAGRDNMGSISANRLTSAATGFGSIATLGATGGNQSETLTVAQVPALSGTTGNESATHTHAYPSISVQIGNGGTIQYTGSVLCPVGSVGCGGAPASTTESANHTHTFTTTGGNGAHPIVMPTSIINYIIKTLPDTNANSFFGVASIGGMTGIITCGFGITCAAGQISAIASTVPPPTLTTLGGVFSLTCSTSNWFNLIDNTGTFGCSQPNFTDLAGTIAGAQIPNNVISNAMIRTSGALSLIGRSANSTGNVADISATAASGCVFEETGSTLACSTVATAGIANSAVTGTKIATNTVANTNLAQSGAATLKGNPTNATANASDFTIQGLTARGAPDATNDKIPLYDNAAGTIKYVTPGQVASSATAGVSSLGGVTGAITLNGAVVTSNVLNIYGNGGVYDAVRQYGADPTGATSSTTAINNAIAAGCAATPGVRGIVYLQPGTYLVNGGINATGITAGCTITGASINSTILETTSASATNAILDLTGSSFVTVQNLQLNSATSTNTKYGILNAGSTTTACNESQFNQISIFGDYQKALVYTYGCTELLWYNSYFTNQPGSSALLAIMIYTTSNVQSAVSSYATIVTGTVAGGGVGHYGIQIHDQSQASGASTVIPVYISGVQSPISFNDSIIAGSVGSSTGGAVTLNNNAQGLTFKNVNFYADNGTQNAYIIYNTGILTGLNIEGCSMLYSTGLLGNTSGSTYLSTKILGNVAYPASILFLNTVTGSSSFIRGIIDVQGMTVNLGASGVFTHNVIFTPGTITAGTQTNNGSF